jgi:TRAP-type C4-dicarboxylate transport system permease small subunit
MRAFLDRLYAAALWLAAASFAVIAALVLVQVLGRMADRTARVIGAPPPGITVPSIAEIGGFLFLGGVFLGLAGTFAAGGHVRVTLLTGALPERAGRALATLVAGGGAALALFASWSSWTQFIDSVTFDAVSYGMVKVPLAIPQGVMTFGLVLLAVALIDAMVTLARGGEPTYAANEGGEG